MIEINKVYNEDCLVGMQNIDTESIDMILCDLPYGTTACKWDTIIPFEKLWEQYKRIIKKNGAIVLTGSQPFTSLLICSNLEMFRYEWIWQKSVATLFQHCNRMPMKKHENILVFYKKAPIYNPQFDICLPYTKKANKNIRKISGFYNKPIIATDIINKETKHPTSLLSFDNGNQNRLHPTQKPVALFEYLIKTYTNEGDLVLDNCLGSGTTAIAAMNTNRNFIGFELDKDYFKICEDRIEKNRKELEIKNNVLL